jgi:hypothetical protein
VDRVREEGSKEKGVKRGFIPTHLHRQEDRQEENIRRLVVQIHVRRKGRPRIGKDYPQDRCDRS